MVLLQWDCDGGARTMFEIVRRARPLHSQKKFKGLIYRILCIQNLQTNQDSQFFVFAFRYFEQSFLLEFKDRAPSNLSHFQRFFCAFPFQRFSVPTSIVSNTLLRFRRCLLLLLLTI